jgi:hypothetical protein
VTSIELSALTRVEGDVDAQNSSRLQQVLLASLLVVLNRIIFTFNPLMSRVLFSSLTTAGSVYLEGLPVLTQLDLPELAVVTNDVLEVYDADVLTQVLSPKLTFVFDFYAVSEAPLCTVAHVPLLASVGGLYFFGSTVPQLSFPSLTHLRQNPMYFRESTTVVGNHIPLLARIDSFIGHYALLRFTLFHAPALTFVVRFNL